MKEIPGLVLGGRRLENVKVAIPYIRTKTNILGLNIIENFKYFVDSTSSRIYFTDNEDFKVPKELKCGKIYSISDQYMLPNGTGLFALNSLSNVSKKIKLYGVTS